MKNSSRTLIAASLAVVICGALSWSYFASRAAQTGGIPELVASAPADATAVVYADVAALRTAPIFRQLVAAAPEPKTDPEYTEFVRATGFDFSRDLDRVLVAVLPGATPASTPGFAVAEGRFDRARIAAYALHTGRLERRQGTDVYVVPANPPAGVSANGSAKRAAKDIAFVFLSNQRLGFAEGASLDALLAAQHGGGLDAAMRERVSRVSGSAIFGVAKAGRMPENFAPGGVRSDQLNALARSLRWFTLGARPDGDRLVIALEGECDTPPNAQQLASTLDGLRVFGQAALADPGARQRVDPQLLTVLDALLRGIQISRDDLRVRLAFELTRELLERLPASTVRNGTGK